MSHQKHHAAVPKSQSAEDLLEWALPELAAQWNGGTENIAIVVQSSSEPLPSAYWMTRTEAAGHCLELANKFAGSDPNAKIHLQHMAVEILKPSAAKELQFSVATADDYALGTLDPKALEELNTRGASSSAVQARKSLIQQQTANMYGCLQGWRDRGDDAQDAVILIIDPKDPRAATVAHVINGIVSEMTSAEDPYNGTPIVVGCPMAKAKALFKKMRPKIFEWLSVRPKPGSTRVVCMAHGGETHIHGRLEVTTRKA